jgi:hypothetical protein
MRCAERSWVDRPNRFGSSATRILSPTLGPAARSMRFADTEAYTSYNEHPVHVAFVRNRWEGEVSNFQELDLVSLTSDDV